MLNTKEAIKAKLDELEIKADHYSRTDWESLQAVEAEISTLNLKYLDLMLAETIEGGELHCIM